MVTTIRWPLILFMITIGLAACAPPTAPPPTPIEAVKVVSIIDPVTGRLTDSVYAQTRVSLAELINQEASKPPYATHLDANDQRFVDATFDTALKGDPAGGPNLWRNPANGRTGEIDLMQWLPDPRRDAVCGILNHRTMLANNIDPLSGSLTICRYSLDMDWQVDSASFEIIAPAPVATTPKVPPVQATAKPAVQPTPQPAPVVNQTPIKPVQEPAPTRKDPRRVITRTPDEIVPPAGSGQTNIGDLLQDQSPHTPAQ